MYVRVCTKVNLIAQVYERHGRRLLCQLVGDSLLEPFWPTGSGCARGFLSALDAAWAVRAWGQSPAPHPLEVIAERESIYRLLGKSLYKALSLSCQCQKLPVWPVVTDHHCIIQICLFI